MTFQEAYEDDLENLFFDLEEFASLHKIDGNEVAVILKEISNEEAISHERRKTAMNPKETAVNKISHVVYMKEKDLKRKLTVNAMIDLDGKKYFVRGVSRISGICKIVIGKYAV